MVHHLSTWRLLEEILPDAAAEIIAGEAGFNAGGSIDAHHPGAFAGGGVQRNRRARRFDGIDGSWADGGRPRKPRLPAPDCQSPPAPNASIRRSLRTTAARTHRSVSGVDFAPGAPSPCTARVVRSWHQSQNSFQVNSYSACAARAKR